MRKKFPLSASSLLIVGALLSVPMISIGQVLPVDDINAFRDFFPFPPRIELRENWGGNIDGRSFNVKNPADSDEIAIYIPQSIHGTIVEISKDPNAASSIGVPLEASVSDVGSPDSTASSLSVVSGQIGIFTISRENETSAFRVSFRTASSNSNRIDFKAKQDVLIGAPTDVFAQLFGDEGDPGSSSSSDTSADTNPQTSFLNNFSVNGNVSGR